MKLVEIVRLRRNPDGNFYVSLMPVNMDEKPKTVFKSNNEPTARNVARQFAKQYKCMVAFEEVSIEIEDDGTDPDPLQSL